MLQELGTQTWVTKSGNMQPARESCYAYFDTVVLLVRKIPYTKDLEFLANHSRSFRKRKSKRIGWTRIDLQNPDVFALQRLSGIWDTFSITPCLSRVDVALDLTTANFEDAAALTAWIEARIVKKNHRIQQIKKFQGTRYTAQRTSRTVNIVTYGDRPSKVTKKPCAHIEFRLQGARTCRSNGLIRAAHLLGFNFREFLERHFDLREIDVVQIGKQAVRKGRSKKANPKHRQLGRLLVRHAMHAAGEYSPTAQSIHDFCGKSRIFNSRTATRKICIEDFLPPPPERNKI